jgi:hypothetical protein
MFLTIIVGTSVISLVQRTIDVATSALSSRIGFAPAVGGMLACLHIWMPYISTQERVFVFRKSVRKV